MIEAVEAIGVTHFAAALIVLAAIIACSILHRRYAKASRQSEAARHLLRTRGQQMSDLVRSYDLAEELGETGMLRFQAEPERQEWSDGLKVLFGLRKGDSMLPGDGETLLTANGINVSDLANGMKADGKVFSERYTVRALDGQERVLNVRATKMETPATEPRQLLAVFLNETQQARKFERLQESRKIAVKEARKAQELASRDPLTNLSNRRHVMNRLDRLLTQQNRGGDALSLIVFDIDHFKRVNDEHGHLAGDAVLRRIARITSEQARDGDVVGRIGGEEFVWVVPGADHDFARIIAERLRQAIALGSAVGPVPPVTISIGYATAMKGDSSLALFARADEALYAAKDAGRNTVRMAA